MIHAWQETALLLSSSSPFCKSSLPQQENVSNKFCSPPSEFGRSTQSAKPTKAEITSFLFWFSLRGKVGLPATFPLRLRHSKEGRIYVGEIRGALGKAQKRMLMHLFKEKKKIP